MRSLAFANNSGNTTDQIAGRVEVAIIGRISKLRTSSAVLVQVSTAFDHGVGQPVFGGVVKFDCFVYKYFGICKAGSQLQMTHCLLDETSLRGYRSALRA